MNLKGRLEKLEEAMHPAKGGPNFCLVVHSEDKDCAQARQDAIAEYVGRHGHEPTDFMNLIPVSAQTKRPVCGCKQHEESEVMA
jgi:hypothetical protein